MYSLNSLRLLGVGWGGGGEWLYVTLMQIALVGLCSALYWCIKYCVHVNMHYVKAQCVETRMINVHYYYE